MAELTREAARQGRTMSEVGRAGAPPVAALASDNGAGGVSRIAARFAKAALTTDPPELSGQVQRSAKFDK
jgi:hypothetical protein